MRDDIQIRNLASHEDLGACVQLQRDTWGQGFNDVVPGSILLVSQKVGGVAAGAFTSGGRLVGFVFGMTGVKDGTIVHWSDMLAVRPEVQNLGVGRRLKEFQRAAVARVGAKTIYWTFDPLVARNAHLNFNVFGVHAVQYMRDMYGGETGSDLHRDIGTDRLIVAWPVDDEELSRRKQETATAREARVYAGAPVIGDVERSPRHDNREVGRSEYLRLAVPDDVAALQATNPTRAVEWRASTRAAFEAAFHEGYHVAGFNLDADQRRGFYLLARKGGGA